MNTGTNANLLPQIIEKKLELGLSGARISLKDFEIASEKLAFELSEVISEKICSLPTVRAQTLWTALDEESRFKLAYPDNGTFNLILVEKLNIRGRTLQEAFVSIHARNIFELDTAQLSTPTYVNAFVTIQCELLATCKQLFAAKPDGKERLLEFLSGFETDFLATVVRHEIARYFIDEEGANLEFDLMENDAGEKVGFIKSEESEDNEIDDDVENYHQPEPLEEFNNIFIKGGTVPAYLKFTSWVQQHAPGIFSTILNYLTFFGSQRGMPVWERPNPTKQEENGLEAKETELKNSRDEVCFTPDLETALRERTSSKNALVSVDSEKEFRRLVRVYCITNPLRKDFLKVSQQDFESQGKIIAIILRENRKETGAIQSFDQLRKAAWDAVGFTSLKQWVDKQTNPERLLNSSEFKWVFDEMKVLGNGAFGTEAIFSGNLEKSKSRVFRLYGWLNLVKIFWNITDQKPRFSDLATIKNDTLYWEENIACCTLIFQLVLGTDKLFFSLDEVARFCELSRDPEWVDSMKQSFRDLAEQNSAISAIPIFDEYINHLSLTGTNIFRIANEIHLSTKAERELVVAVKDIADEHFNVFIDSLGNKEKTEMEIKNEIDFLFVFATAALPRIGAYIKEAEGYLNYLFEQGSIPDDITSQDIAKISSMGSDKDD